MISSLLLLAATALPAPGDTVPLYTNLGSHHYGITTAVPRAQQYFDQGLRLYYAFNHAEAIRSFREAQRLDPTCAMCAWGEALAWGPNINMPMDSAAGAAAHEAVARARGVQGNATPVEQALIAALSRRYLPVPPADRAALDSAYARAMGEVARTFPADPEAAVLYAEALMDLRPWNYWTAAGEPQPGMGEAISALERVQNGDPQHPGACHFYIHAVEAVHPERAVACAERLAGLMPGAGHLVHMPGHIYIRVGRYLDAIRANEHAVHADEQYIRDQRPGAGMYTLGYYPHNFDFLAFAAAMAGRRAQAIEAADHLAALAAPSMGEPGMAFTQHHATRPLQLRIRFERWEEILAASAPAAEHRHARAMWHYARGRALAATGRVADARSDLEALRAAVEDPRLQGVRLEFNESPAILRVAAEVLAGHMAAATRDFPAAIRHLERAAELEDALGYGEPPDWTIPVRQDLGAVLLAAGRLAEAEQAFRKDLSRFPKNGWSLRGLADALEAQGLAAEARDARRALRRAWEDSERRSGAP